MKSLRNAKKNVGLLACAAILVTFAFSLAQARTEQYSFRVHNKTNKTIEKILASEDGETYGHFDIGDGIEAGKTVKIVWAKSTNDQSCVQFFTVVFDDGSHT